MYDSLKVYSQLFNLLFRFIMYLALALLKVALVNFTLNEYMMMT